ncbi:hypothetical protein ACJX0J_007217 [Zea mays]
MLLNHTGESQPFAYGTCTLLEQVKRLGVEFMIRFALIQLTGFMEKNTVKFMKELWSLLLSAQLKNASGVPQQFLDEKEAEIHQKKEIQKKPENEGMDSELEKNKTMNGDHFLEQIKNGQRYSHAKFRNQATLSTCSNSGLHYLSGQGTSQSILSDDGICFREVVEGVCRESYMLWMDTNGQIVALLIIYKCVGKQTLGPHTSRKIHKTYIKISYNEPNTLDIIINIYKQERYKLCLCFHYPTCAVPNFPDSSTSC